MSEKALFKYYNPKAFKELRGIVTEKEFINNNLEAIDIDNSGIGLFKCSDKSHYYLQFIRKRGLKVYDKNCPLCYMESETSNLKIINQTIKTIKMHNYIATQFICYKCKSIWIKYRNDIHYDIKDHLLICDERSKNITSFETSHPEIAKEYSENNCFPIEILSYDGWQDNKSTLNWTCSKCNNNYQATVRERVKKGEKSCPYCNELFPIFKNSLKYKYPEIAEEWDKRNSNFSIKSEHINIDIDPTKNLIKRRGIELKGFFSCKSCKIIYPRKIREIINQCDCELCMQGASIENTKLVFSEMNITDEDNYILHGKNEICSFQCSKCGKIYNANLRQRLLNNYICPVCDNRVAVPGKNSFKIMHPYLLNEWDYSKNHINPDSVFETYSMPVYWICPCEKHSYEMSIKQRLYYYTENRIACPYCDNRKLLQDWNSFGKKYSQLLLEWDFSNNVIDPYNILSNQLHRINWKCPNGHHYPMTIKTRIYCFENNEVACPFCSKSFQIDYPELAREWDYYKNEKNPDEVFSDYKYEVYWTCNKNHSYKMRIKERIYHSEQNSEPCPYCSNRVVLPGFNSFKQKYPELLYEWDSLKNNIDPDEIFPSYNHEVYWLCNNNHSYKMKIKERIYHSEQKSEPCPYCSNRVVLPEFNSFKALNKDLMKEWNSINNYLITDPDIILPTNNTYLIYWTCENNHTYKMSPKSRTLYKKRNQTACPICKGLRQPKAHYF